MNQFNVRMVCFDDDKEARFFSERFVSPTVYGSGHMSKKASFINLYAEKLRDPAVQILKESLLSVGGEAVSNRDVLVHQAGTSAVLMMGTRAQFDALEKRLKLQQFGLPVLAEEIKAVLSNIEDRGHREIAYDGGSLIFGKKTLVMGILNCTPDSFSDGGKWLDPQRSIEHALAMEAAGADIIDIGGESTRPGSAVVSAEEEMARILPVIEVLRGKLSVPISVDTYKAETAAAAIKSGAQIINDVWGFQYDDGEMAAVAAKAQCPVILMHNKTEAVYKNMMAEITAFLRRSMEIAVAAGCGEEKLILDPGFGFGKNLEDNLLVTKKLRELTSLGRPLLMAASRKKTVGLVLDASADQRIWGDAAVTALSIANGADIVRVHDVKEMAQVAKMADAIVDRGYQIG